MNLLDAVDLVRLGSIALMEMGWCSQNWAQDADNEKCEWDAPEAQKWGLLGAIESTSAGLFPNQEHSTKTVNTLRLCWWSANGPWGEPWKDDRWGVMNMDWILRYMEEFNQGLNRPDLGPIKMRKMTADRVIDSMRKVFPLNGSFEKMLADQGILFQDL